ncbi:creatininase family protein [Cohaesibacter sp. CAU 1516]|uniref:creatininase family protein n=1 Tax=Cohaesibacter sp. CAU 1516 TaxID=2576038 RepID=UPI001AED7DDF|nr:creatininase family protein [Cohaesibacter sp. CAU 1516]
MIKCPMIKRLWRDMSRDEIAALSVRDPIAVLPIAAIEQHGPHLPTGTDALLAEGYVERCIERMDEGLPLVFLPVQQVGWSEEHLDAVGTVTSSWKTLLPLWTDIALSVKRAGIHRLLVINSHGGNVPLMDILIQDLRVHHGMQASATNWLRFGYPDGMFTADEIAYGIHGGEVETALMLAMRPDLVQMDKAAMFSSAQQARAEQNDHARFYGRKQTGWLASDLNPRGVVGNAALAAPEVGQQLLDHLVDGFLAYATELQRLPLPSPLSNPVR